jgi:hypothetical protein
VTVPPVPPVFWAALVQFLDRGSTGQACFDVEAGVVVAGELREVVRVPRVGAERPRAGPSPALDGPGEAG